MASLTDILNGSADVSSIDDNMMNRLVGGVKVEIVNGIFFRAPNVAAPVNRPMAFDVRDNVSLNSLDTLGQMLGSGETVSEYDIKRLGASIIKVQTESEGIVHIPNGWENTRLRFYLEFRVEQRGEVTYEILTGYTSFDADYNMVSSNNQVTIDPTMRLYFNNSIRLKETKTRDPLTGALIYTRNLVSGSHILTKKDGTGNMDEFRATPKSIITPANLLRSYEYSTGSHFGGIAGGVLDTRNMVSSTQGVDLVSRSNASGGQFLNTMIKGISNSLTEANITSNHGPAFPSHSALFSKAAERVLAGEKTVSSNAVLTRMRQMAGFGVDNSVSYGDFLTCFPGAGHRINLVSPDDLHESYESRDMTYATGGSHFDLRAANSFNVMDWRDSSMVTIKAQQLLALVPAVMMDCLISDIIFNATNMGTLLTDPVIVNARDAGSILGDNTNVMPFLNLFYGEYINRIHPVISDNDRLLYVFTMHCNLMGEIRMTIQYDGDMPYHYNTGAYCDHLYTPNLTKNHDHLMSMSNDMSSLTSLLIGA